MSDNKISSYLEEHPRMIGVLFTAFLLLSQAGSALAGSGTTIQGP